MTLWTWWLNFGEDGWLQTWWSLPLRCKLGLHKIAVEEWVDGEPGKQSTVEVRVCQRRDCGGFFGYLET